MYEWKAGSIDSVKQGVVHWVVNEQGCSAEVQYDEEELNLEPAMELEAKEPGVEKKWFDILIPEVLVRITEHALLAGHNTI